MLIERGTTIIELVVTLAVIAIVALGATHHPPQMPLSEVARKIKGVIDTAWLEALLTGSKIRLTVTPGVLLIASPHHTNSLPIASSVMIEAPSELPLRISFYPSGVATPTRVTFRHGLNRCTITLALRGRTRLSCAV